MALGDSFRRFFAKKRNPQLKELEAFASERKGVEGYIEPRTATHPVSLLLVDREGDNLRGAVDEPSDAVAFCEKRGIPVYEAKVVGYPQRMRDFDLKGRRATTEEVDAQIAEIEKRLNEPGPSTPDN